MLLKRPFLKLPIRFDAEALASELRALPESAWVPHPTGFVGNEAVRLVSPSGEETDEIEGPMGPTESLQRCDYVRQVMAELGGVWGRSRFMGLAPGREVPSHIDIHYYWRTHFRIHIPVITNPGVEFTCGGETVHMAPGECWLFDSFRWHNVQNKGTEQRIHLVLDTVGGGRLPELMKAAERGSTDSTLVTPSEASNRALAFETVNSPNVMSPWEMRCHLAFIREHAGDDPLALTALDRVDEFIAVWAAAWARFGTDGSGRPTYQRLLTRVRSDISSLGINQLTMPNGLSLTRTLGELLFRMALADPDRRFAGPNSDAKMSATPTAKEPVQAHADQSAAPTQTSFDRPILIVSTPRSGSTLLYETLVQAPHLFSTGDESHRLIESLDGLSPRQRNWSSNRLTTEDATAERAQALTEAFYHMLKDRDGRPPKGPVRMLEKTPKNALRVPFFDAIWPDSQFIYLYRDVRSTLSSMMEAWQSGGFRTYRGLPGWSGLPWSLLLVPGWESLRGKPLAEIVAHQWAITTNILLDDLEQVGGGRVHIVDHSAFLTSPRIEIERLTNAVGLSWDRPLEDKLPLSKTTVSKPDPHKWRRIEQVINAIWPIVEQADARAKAFIEQRGADARAAA